MDATMQIAKLKDEIEGIAALEDQLRRFIRRGCTPEQKLSAERQLQEIDRRIMRAYIEIGKLDSSKVTAFLRRERDTRYPPIETRAAVRFFGIETIGRRIAA